ncbi:GIY-YIG nuclease family protein, partial [Mesorhizobium sp. M3A.F.Ca.ET.175.01.1.1]
MALSTEEITKVDRFIRTFDLGLIYIIASDAGGPVKIGKSSLLSGRLDSLQIGNPSELFVYAAFVFDRGKAHAVEQLLHRALGASWLRGEWYSLSASEAKSACRRIIRYGANGTSPGQNRKKATKPT